MSLVKKQLPIGLVALKADAATGRFEGYASRFGGKDSYGDTIMQGAYKRTLAKFGKPKMFYSHSWDKPIGKWLSAKEDDAGLYVEGELTPNLALAEDVRAMLMHETLDGLSVGGFVKREDTEELEDGGVLIHHFTKLVEVSPCVFPADDGARIDLATVRGIDLEDAIGDVETIRDFERLLRDAGGFSKTLAATLTSKAKKLFGPEGEPPRTPQGDAAVEKLNARMARIQKLGTL